jgi:hypothetical protein
MTRNTYVPYVEMLNQNQQKDPLILTYVTFMNVYTSLIMFVNYLVVGFLMYSIFKYSSLIMFVNYRKPTTK